MALLIDEPTVAKLGWDALLERSWTELRVAGFPPELVDLACDLGQRNERPIRVYTLPTMEAGVAGLAVPFIHDDGLLFDPSLLGRAGDLRSVVTRAMSHLLYPGWEGLVFEAALAEMQAFGRILAPKLLRRLPSTVREAQPGVDTVMALLRAA